MKILYSAIDQSIPAAHGGAVHVTAVAEGLAALGHEVHVLATPGAQAFPTARVNWQSMGPPLGLRQLRFMRAGAVRRIALALQPDVIVERYYNFGGEAILSARRLHAVAVLEVNAPVIDYPGSTKHRLDQFLLVEPMRRWRERLCRSADLIVTPSAKMIPAFVPASRVLTTEWGADTTRFHPGAGGQVPFSREPSDTIVVFAGAFRAWHGAIHLIEAMRRLRERGRHDIITVLIGAGPELSRVRAAAAGLSGITFTGAVPHDQMPACLAAADVGVAPFDLTAHRSLAWEFHWSPLKIFEYMASGLPVVAPRIERLAHIIRDGIEGVLYEQGDPGSLAAALERLANAGDRRALGTAARLRAVQLFSWQRHCERLDQAIRAAHAGVQNVAECAS